MKIAICKVLVTFVVGDMQFVQKEKMEGYILKKDNKMLLVDFSTMARGLNFIGDYSKVLISKDECLIYEK